MNMQDFIRARSTPDANGCWLWNGSHQGTGYGDFRMNKVTRTAHRTSYEAFFGPIPKGMHVLHKCDVRRCCNPEHLFVGTNADNIADSVAKGRRKGITRRRPSGLKYNWVKRPGTKPKLSDDARAQLRADYLTGGWKKTDLAAKYGIHTGSIYHTYLRDLL